MKRKQGFRQNITTIIAFCVSRCKAIIPGLHLPLVWLLTLSAASPLFQPNTLTHSADNLLHLYRLVALQQAISQGALFPRWLPDLAYGYGLPLFVFYAPLSYYLTLTLSLPGLSLVNALNLSFILALLLAATGAYLFVKDLLGLHAGFLAAVAYAYAPFQFLNTLSRGSLPAAWAMAAFPFVFWAFGRLIRSPTSFSASRLSSIYFPLSALLLGAALLMHNAPNLLFVPLLMLYVGIELLVQFASQLKNTDLSLPDKLRLMFHQIILPVTTAGLLGLALAAFYLLPALFEKQFAQVERVIISPDFDFRYHFLHLSDLLALPPAANTGLLNPSYPFSLGLAQVGLAVVGLVGIWRLREKRQWATTGFALLGLVGSIFMMLPASLPVWEQFPLLAFVQHPFRLLGPAALALAILAGLAVAAWPERWRLGVTLTGISLIFLTSLPLLYPRYQEPFSATPTLLDMFAYEHATGTIGTTSFGEYLPIWVKQTPDQSPLESMYQAGATIERLDRAYLPAGAKIETASYSFNQADLLITSPQPYQAVFHTFYFPGWTALADNQPAPIAPVTERGLIGVTMPAGQHRLQLDFTETPLRWAADVVSLASLVIIVILFILRFTRLIPNPGEPEPERINNLTRRRQGARTQETIKIFALFPCTGRQLVWLAGLGLVMIFFKVGYVDHFGTPFKHTFDDTLVAGAEVSLKVKFGNQINLLGYDLNQHSVAAGQKFDLTAYWQARQPLFTNYSSLAQLVDTEHHLYAGQDNLHPGQVPTSQWPTWSFTQDPHTLYVPPGTPPGDYFLVTGLYDPSTWARLPVLAGGDPTWADVFAIPVILTKAARPPAVEELGIAWPVNETCQASKTWQVSTLCLLGATPERQAIRPNDFLRVALFWEAVTNPTTDYRISLRLVNGTGQVVLEETNQPSFNRYPTTQWTAGERVRDNHALWIPPDFPTGVYHLQTQILDDTNHPLSDWLDLGQLARGE